MVDHYHEVLLAVQADPARGEEMLAAKWPEFFYGLRALLRDDGREQEEDRENLLLFRFPNPTKALTSFFARLKQVKQRVGWDQTRGEAPLRLVLCLPDLEPLPELLTTADPEAWQQLPPEVPHLSRKLKEQWRQLSDSSRIGFHTLGDEEDGLSPLLFSEEKPRQQRPPLFPHRHLPRRGNSPPCFYCSQTNHEPASCPAKMLTMQTQGLPTVGYLPLEELAQRFAEAMGRQQDLDNLLLTGISPGQLRQDNLLRVYLSYYDLNKVFQPRFLAGIAFSPHSHWDELGRPEATSADNSSLFMGLDCLRVGQYRQADDLFINESRRPRGKQLYAAIGRALVALEQNRLQDMAHYLANALKMAIANKDRIYVCLLLYRHYLLQGDFWKAAHSLDNILAIDRECAEAIYRQIQLAVAEDSLHEALHRLSSLVAEEKLYFIHVLMDPELLPLQDDIDNILHNRLQNQRQEAEENLAQTRAVAEEMEHWLEPEEPALKELRDDLALLEQQWQQGSYYDLVDVAVKSKRINQRCYRLQEARIDALQERIIAAGKRLTSFKNFWQSYPHTSFFPEFGETLKSLHELTTKTDRGGQKNLTGASYRALVEALDESEEKFNRLKELTVKMVWVRNLFKGGKQFIRSLVAAELALISLTLVLLATLLLLSADSPAASGLAEVLRDQAVQKRLLTTVTLILAPFAALIHTLWRSLEQ
ncbi:tetratricopeptide repeat protein [Desulfurivibrio alkaliphilus]|uniref:Tetratricopeptide repeat protein n=1 Tax=Desulfurivibrio alkaliphilus (strain DSM 19089 / UNIQEM U267 / AHT2) TaxID=589865 RepID=D6Z3W7_DESAT|nr:hypothetical protein [Desulfurivibrio alkaliphilus]ADH86242.1 hypothetical protein DaAHT2_1547 [Desulfurivibrio alkaliphilus AHT 2]